MNLRPAWVSKLETSLGYIVRKCLFKIATITKVEHKHYSSSINIAKLGSNYDILSLVTDQLQQIQTPRHEKTWRSLELLLKKMHIIQFQLHDTWRRTDGRFFVCVCGFLFVFNRDCQSWKTK